MTNKLEILPCPFCGSEKCSPNYHNARVWVDCDSCGVRGQTVSSKWSEKERGPSIEEAISPWNKRAAPVVEPVPPLIQTLHANGDRIAMEATIAQQAQRIADLEAAPVVEDEPEALKRAWQAGYDTGFYAKNPAHERGAPVVERQDVQVAAMPVERCYDVRVKMIMAFNEAKKNGGDLDDALDAAYKSALRFSPNPLIAEQPAPVAVDTFAGFKVVVDETMAPNEMRLCNCNQGRLPCTCKSFVVDGKARDV